MQAAGKTNEGAKQEGNRRRSQDEEEEPPDREKKLKSYETETQ